MLFLFFLISHVAFGEHGSVMGQVQLMGGLKEFCFVRCDSGRHLAHAWFSVDEEPPLYTVIQQST